MNTLIQDDTIIPFEQLQKAIKGDTSVLQSIIDSHEHTNLPMPDIRAMLQHDSMHQSQLQDLAFGMLKQRVPQSVLDTIVIDRYAPGLIPPSYFHNPHKVSTEQTSDYVAQEQ